MLGTSIVILAVLIMAFHIEYKYIGKPHPSTDMRIAYKIPDPELERVRHMRGEQG